MEVRTFNTTLIAALFAVSGAAQAGRGDGDGFSTRARVLASTPVFETINEPTRVCWTETTGYETRTYSDGHNTGIYTFKRLRDLCECPEHSKKGESFEV